MWYGICNHVDMEQDLRKMLLASCEIHDMKNLNYAPSKMLIKCTCTYTHIPYTHLRSLVWLVTSEVCLMFFLTFSAHQNNSCFELMYGIYRHITSAVVTIRSFYTAGRAVTHRQTINMIQFKFLALFQFSSTLMFLLILSQAAIISYI